MTSEATNCYLFLSDNNGHLYRSQTTIGNFPNGFNTPVIVMTDSRSALLEAANVDKVKRQNQYLLIVEAIGSNGQWTALADTESNPRP